jgi:hypothetical protein
MMTIITIVIIMLVVKTTVVVMMVIFIMFVMTAVLQWPRCGALTAVIRMITVALNILRSTKNQAEALPRYLFIYRKFQLKYQEL